MRNSNTLRRNKAILCTRSGACQSVVLKTSTGKRRLSNRSIKEVKKRITVFSGV